ncbi:helix-turn-helix domain-containing protein [Avibacterium paragallinarum]|uniref:Uncharacterized protein n=1 Tax=Avibacterium paragallinarum TaxID=728 RepID=A0A380X677_AVIPA|nr:helix-turn-helix domain-containing protein [Avibacterium paragallinarum]SUU98731.1 Uncharacterised protein [Avibacterium paragallinarum]
MTPIEKAILAVGSQAKLAKALGKNSQFIYRMKKSGEGSLRKIFLRISGKK